MRRTVRHWVESLQILEKIGTSDGLRAFVDDGVDCGFSRQEIADLYATFFEDRLAEALALAVVHGDYPGDNEFTRRLREVLLLPQQMFQKGKAGRRSLPVHNEFFQCFREATVAVEGSFHRFVEGDYDSSRWVSTLIREAYEAMLQGNLARAYDRLTSAGARVLEGDYLAHPTEWMETDPLYSWLLGLERMAHVVRGLEGWQGGRFEHWPDRRRQVARRVDPLPETEMTPARKSVLRLLNEEEFDRAEFTRMRRNRKWIGPELLRLLRMPDDDTTTLVIRNAVRSLGAVAYEPAVDDLLGLLMRSGLSDDEDADGYVAACEEALMAYGPGLKEKLFHHLELAFVDRQRIALARVLSAIPDDDEVMTVLEELTADMGDEGDRVSMLSIIADYRHRRSRPFLRSQMRAAERSGQIALSRYLGDLVRPRRRNNVRTAPRNTL